MHNAFPLRTAWKIAWRESRASTAKFLFVVVAVAVGVGSLAGVRGFSRSFRSLLLKEARTLMAADLSVRVFELPTADQEDVFRNLEGRGIRRTWVTETISMMAPEAGGDPMLVSVKAVDPTVYPFYGAVKLNPPSPLSTALTADQIGVSEDLLVRMDARVGDRMTIGGAGYRIAAAVTSEPDRMAGSLNIGPRVLMSREALERTGLLQPGSRAAQRFLFRLPPEASVERTRRTVQRAFPTALIADFRQTHPLVTRGLDRATTFLSLVSLIALVVGALGVATAIESHLQQKMDSIAVMKSIGGRSGQIIRIYLLQGLMLAIAGACAGLLVGQTIQAVFPWMLGKYFNMTPTLRFEWLSAAEALLIGVLTTLLFTLPPLLGIRDIQPLRILRRDMDEAQPPLRDRWRRWVRPGLAALLILAGVAGVAVWLVEAEWKDASRVAGWFVVGLVASLLVLAALSWLLLRGLRSMARTSLWKTPAAIRHGVANLYRPGNHAQSVLVALSVGVMFTLTIYLIQHSLISQLTASAPPGMPNVFLINITSKQADDVRAILKNAPGVEGEIGVVPSVAGRLMEIDGELVAKRKLDGPGRRFMRERSITWSDKIPENTEVKQGQWWTRWSREAPEVSISEEAARILAIKPGARTLWTVQGRRVSARVAAIHVTETVRPGSNIDFIFTPQALDGLPVLYFGGVRVRPKDIAPLQRTMYQRFPSVSVINVADVLDRVQEVVDQIALVVRFISGFSILAGIIILASSVAGTRFRRIREVVILKTLGATRRRVSAIYSVEFLLLGLAAGIMGSAMAVGFSNLILKKVLETQYRFDLVPNLVAIVATAVIANVAGWLASYRILDQKPLEALRNE
ncbi:MAG: ABC transporter permease [Bryobacteraceae bacterium]